MDDPNITMDEYIRLEEEKALSRGETFNWQTATYSKMEYYEDEDESDDEYYTVIYDKNIFSYKIISVDNVKTDSENDNDKVNMPSFLSPEPDVSYSTDLDFFKYFENEFPAIVYNDALTSKLDFLIEPTISPQHIDEFNLKDETSLSEGDEEEQNVLYFNHLFPFNVIYPDDLKSDTDNGNDEIANMFGLCFYVLQVGCELCKGPHYTKDCPQKKEGKTLEEAYYTQFGAPYQPGGQYRAAGPGFYQRNKWKSSFNTTAGNPVKKILLKLNLSDHRLFKDGGGGS
ncbi:hypothetical protein Tco_1214313 [Tanacetum coccineum]